MRKTLRPLHIRLPYLLLLPSLLLLGGLLIYPWLSSLWLSLHDWSPLVPGPPEFIGVQNYADYLAAPSFWNSVLRTIGLVVGSVSIQFIVGFGTALLLNSVASNKWWALTLCIIPMMMTPSIVGLMWKVLLHGQWGIFNYFLNAAGLPRVGWLSDPAWTLPTLILVEVWLHTPFVTLVMLAGLKAIPNEMYEAAAIDGASPIQTLINVIFPWLRSLIFIVLLFRVMFAIRVFDTVYSMFPAGGPRGNGMVLGVYLYEQFRVTWKLGAASSLSYLLLALTFLLTAFFVFKLYRSGGD